MQIPILILPRPVPEQKMRPPQDTIPQTREERGVYDLMTGSEFIRDFRQTAAKHTRGCIVLERPDLVAELVKKHGARDTTQRGTALPELDMLTPRNSQHLPGLEVPEKHWMYRFAKKHYYFGFGAYT